MTFHGARQAARQAGEKVGLSFVDVDIEGALMRARDSCGGIAIERFLKQLSQVARGNFS